eukprot:Gb_28850 [translate_table: standard]
MYSSQSVKEGLKLPPTTLARSTSNGMKMGYSEKSQQDLMEVDCSSRPSVCSNNDNHMQQQASSGLMRYCSAPSSFLASVVEEANDYLPRGSGPQEPAGNLIARYFSVDSSSLTSESSCGAIQSNGSNRSNQENQHHPGEPNTFSRMNGTGARLRRSSAGNDEMAKHPHLASILENGPEVVSQDSYCSSQMMHPVQGPGSGMENSYRMNQVCCNPLDSSGTRHNNLAPPSTKSTLTRHSSSPAGLLSRLVVEGQGVFENGYPVGAMRNIGNLASENGSCGDMVSPNRLKSQMSFSRQSSSPAGLLSQLSEMGMPEVVDKLNLPVVGSSAESLGGSSSDDGSLGNGNGGQCYITGFQIGSWEDAAMLSENFAGMQNGAAYAARKRVRELNGKMIPGLNLIETQKGEPGSHVPSTLNHQFSLPKSTSEIAMEKLLQDSVPCKIRAKRGCATHPRSIAERVRRTRISERMRKLQELVPNMDKQTNTADMLDEAVDYIKFLQTQVQELSENRPKCKCSCKHTSEN